MQTTKPSQPSMLLQVWSGVGEVGVVVVGEVAVVGGSAETGEKNKKQTKQKMQMSSPPKFFGTPHPPCYILCWAPLSSS